MLCPKILGKKMSDLKNFDPKTFCAKNHFGSTKFWTPKNSANKDFGSKLQTNCESNDILVQKNLGHQRFGSKKFVHNILGKKKVCQKMKSYINIEN